MNKSEFESQFRELARSYAALRDNQGCIDCVGCERCSASTFCRNSKNLARSHYCVDCEDCTDCSHGRKCVGCLACHHCAGCERCVQSAYLIRCVGLTSCSYCFGCVGLSHKDYHILNEPYDRKTYYEITNRISRELGLSKGK
jgi:hypothetical protein